MSVKECQELIKTILKLELFEVRIETPKIKLTIKTTS